MKLLVAGISIGLVLGVALTAMYFALATFFAVQSERRNASRKTAGTSITTEETTSAPVKDMKAGAGK